MLQHTLSEIKKFNSKVYCPVTRLQNINRALAEIINFDASDDMYDYLTNRYLQQLDGYHVNGRSGSLLPKGKSPEAAASEASYEAYARWESLAGREAAAAIGLDTYRRAMAEVAI